MKYNKEGYLNDFHKKSQEASKEAVEWSKNQEFTKADFLKQTARLKREKLYFVHLIKYKANDITETDNICDIGISNSNGTRESKEPINTNDELLAFKKFTTIELATNFIKPLHQTYYNKRFKDDWFCLNKEEVQEIIKLLN